jgi:hypothetical protein
MDEDDFRPRPDHLNVPVDPVAFNLTHPSQIVAGGGDEGQAGRRIHDATRPSVFI